MGKTLLCCVLLAVIILPAAAQNFDTKEYEFSVRPVTVSLYFGAESITLEYLYLFRELEQETGDKIVDQYFPLSSGSGFFISEEGHLITNSHVIDTNAAGINLSKIMFSYLSTISKEYGYLFSEKDFFDFAEAVNRVFIEGEIRRVVLMPDGNEYELRLLHADKKRDLALLQLAETKKTEPTRFLRSQDIEKILKVFSIGYPLPDTFSQYYDEVNSTISAGIISARREKVLNDSSETKIRTLQHTASINSGNSGGPLVTDSGLVVGVNSFLLTDANNIYFAVSMEEVADWLKEINMDNLVIYKSEKDAETVIASQKATGVGSIFIESDPPGADIFINGKKWGTSPGMMSNVPVGNTKVEVWKDNLYGEETIEVGKGKQKLEIELFEAVGNLFMKSTNNDVDVFIDGKSVGKLESGAFKDLPVGIHRFELFGDEVYWKDEIEIQVNESKNIEVTPLPYGSLRYMLPEGAAAEVCSSHFSETIQGNGLIEYINVGQYTVTVRGDDYHGTPLQESVTIEQNGTALFSPELLTHEEAFFSEISADIEKLETRIGAKESVNEQMENQVQDIQNRMDSSGYDTAVMDKRIISILDYIRPRRELQELYSEINAIEDEIGINNRIRKNRTIGGFAVLSAGALIGGLSGLFQILAINPYQDYINATITEDAVEYRRQVQLFDTLTWVSAGTGGASLAASVFFFVIRPNNNEHMSRIDQISAKIREIESNLR